MIPFYTKHTQGGFSLVEMLVAVSILLIVIVGPMTVTSRTAKSSSYATEQVQAFFLAQEGIELIQKVRDDMLLEQFDGGGTAWDEFTDATGSGVLADCYDGTGCGISWDAGSGTIVNVVSCDPVTGCELRFNDAAERSFYNHSLGITSSPAFTRVVRLVDQGERVSVTSTVTWRTGSLVASQEAKVETYLYDIYQP
jgi:prepilin-type N-terminal cleavage/methylation domain-containing protein